MMLTAFGTAIRASAGRTESEHPTTVETLAAVMADTAEAVRLAADVLRTAV
jgi:hypothetical protein